MHIMTFDIGERLGFARGRDNGSVTWGTEHLEKTGEDLGLCGLGFESFLRHQFLNVARPDLVAYAQIPIMPHQAMAQRKLLGMAFLLETVCARLNIGINRVWESSARSYFLSPRKVPRHSPEIKKAVLERCAELGWAVTDSNAADSLCVLDYVKSLSIKGWPSAAERSGLFSHEA
jgi:hypothetical protein